MNGYTGECTICGEELPDADDKPCDVCQEELNRAEKELVNLALHMPTNHVAEAVRILKAVMEKISVDEAIETEKWK